MSTNQNVIQEAREQFTQHQPDEVRIDDNANVVEVDDGYWVDAVVFVSRSSMEYKT
jgi:hypothetical protein